MGTATSIAAINAIRAIGPSLRVVSMLIDR